MTQKREINGKKYLSAREASKLVSYSSDYIGRLAREKKILAERVGNQWFVEPESLKFFTLNAEAEKRNRKELLREERLVERAKKIRQNEEETFAAALKSKNQIAIAQTAIISACFFLFLNIVWFSLESKLNVQALFGGLTEIGGSLSEKVMAPIPDFLSQVASFAFVQSFDASAQKDDILPTKQDAIDSSKSDFQGIVLFDEVEEVTAAYIDDVRESFSDEVQVEFDTDDSGVITPVFKERTGDSYRFLLVPVKPPGR